VFNIRLAWCVIVVFNDFVTYLKATGLTVVNAKNSYKKINIMKNAKTILVLLLISISSYSIAGYGENKFKNKIEKQIMYPLSSKIKKVDAKVHVEFSINCIGEIIIDKINSTNKEINDYVIEKLKEFKVEKGNEVIGKSFIYNFSFEVEK